MRLNRDLFREFAAFLAAADWDVALLQEAPPRWSERLADATGATAHVALTSRNWMRPLTSPFARARPQLVGSWEGGSNLTLVRGAMARAGRRKRPGMEVESFSRATLTHRPERRVVSLVELGCGLHVANFHASTGEGAAADVMRAARLVDARASEAPALLGGDFNLRPDSSGVFARLEDEFGFGGATGPAAIDHLLARGVERVEAGTAWPDGRRDVPDPGTDLLIRLSDHPPVVTRIGV